MKKIFLTLLFAGLMFAAFAQPAGTIIAFAGKSIPKGWELCDGREVSKTDAKYSALYKVIRTTWGGNDNPNFKLPDLRNQFLMGVANTSEVAQSGGSAEHNHGGTTSNAFPHPDGYHIDPDDRNKAPQCTGLAHAHDITPASNLPPFQKVIYIIKL